MEIKTVVTLTKKEIQDIIIEKIRPSIPNATAFTVDLSGVLNGSGDLSNLESYEASVTVVTKNR